MVKERVSFVKDLWEETDYFFKAPESYDSEVIRKRWKENTSSMLLELIDFIQDIENFTAPEIEASVKEWIERKGYNIGAVMTPFRLVIVGSLRGPHMFDIISWLGKSETISRIRKGISIIGNQPV